MNESTSGGLRGGALFAAIAVAVAGAAPVVAAGQDAASFAAEAEKAAAAGREAKAVSVAGAAPGWLFLVNELEHVGRGEFWKAYPNGDPVGVIAAYNGALSELGVDLVVVPVPAKASVYPEKFAPGATAMTGAVPAADAVFGTKPFLDALGAAGVKAVDLEEVYRAARAQDDSAKLYCEQDAHWSPLGAELAAGAVYDVVEGADWLAAAEKTDIDVAEPEEITIKGDMVEGEFADLAAESLTVRRAGADGGATPVDVDEASPVLLIGDSHLRVFTDGGEFHTRGAGFRDHLQAKLGLAANAEFNNGDGVFSPRVRVAKDAKGDPDYWASKKLVVWCFSVRALTAPAASIKWRELPAQP